MRHDQGKHLNVARSPDRTRIGIPKVVMHTEGLPDHRLGNRQWQKEDRSEAKSREYEEEHVHDVYQQIASHFSSTRYKVGSPDIIRRRVMTLMKSNQADDCPPAMAYC